MNTYTLIVFLTLFGVFASPTAADPPASAPRKTTIDIQGENFLINKQPTLKGKTWRGMNIEGLLPNSRMVQGVFDDLNPETRKNWAYPDGKPFDADRNTNEFLAAMPAWKEHGLLAFTLNLQGGSPYGYSSEQPWINSAFAPDGSLRDAYMARLEKILDKADDLGMVVILGFFYFGQEPKMQGEEAVKNAVATITKWLVSKNYANVLVEVANETNVHYKDDILQPNNTGKLFDIVREQSKGKVKNAIGQLYVSTSLSGGAIPEAGLVKQVDFVLLHGNGGNAPGRIEKMVDAVRKLPTWKNQPIVFNEDDHFDFDKPDNNFLTATRKHASWGYFDFRKKTEPFETGFQCVPVDWTISTDRKKAFFNLVKEMTTAAPPSN